MKKHLLFLITWLCLFQTGNLFGQSGQTCSTANVFCTGTNYNFPNTTTNPVGIGQVSCLFSTPNPVWYYMQISQAGDIGISLNQIGYNGISLDVDFILWGPFTSLADACANYTSGNVVDCSYSASASEHIEIMGALPGQYYLLMMTNFSQQPGNITFSSDASSTAATAGAGQLTIASNLPVCAGDSVTLTASGGVAGHYTWTSPNNQVFIADTLVISNLQPANYGTYIVTSGNGICSSIGSVSVVGSQAPAAISNSPVCLGGTLILQADSSFLSYSWTGPNGFTSNVQSPVITNAASTHAGQYTVYGQLGNCMSAPGVVQVSVDTTGNLTVSAPAIPPLNQGGTLFLSASGSNGQYNWTGPNGFTATGLTPYIQNVSPANAGVYSVSVTAAGCNSATAQTIVVVNPLNQVSGMVYSDDNNNGVQDTGENPLSGVVVTFQPGWQTAITNSLGEFTAFVPDNSYTLSIGGLYTYQTANPASYLVTVAGNAQVVTGNNFGIYSPPVNDLKVTITEVWTAAPGFVTHHRITYRNLGNSPISGTVQYKPDSLLVLNGSTTPGYTTIGDTLVWSFTNLMPNQTGNLHVYLTVPVGTALGTTLNSLALITPLSGDADSLNNTFALTQVVTGSWDPNDKAVQPAGPITLQQVTAGQNLIYTIRFQNTGTAPAVNILVADTLSSNLDLSTFQMLSSSHTYELTMRENGILEWRFNNIMLPDSNSNEPDSHGDIQYQITPKNSLAIGDEILNTAHIFFDFNEAVVTNTTSTPVGVLALEEWIDKKSLSVFPNPNTGNFTLQLSNAEGGQVQVNVLNMLGQLVYTSSAAVTTAVFEQEVDLGKLPSGIYLLKLGYADKSFTKRVVIQEK